MKSDPLVSIIIPAYNCKSYIVEALDSVLNQTWKNIEVIVINDGSTDGTRSILEGYDQSKKIILINSKNMGACHARNLGIRKCTGDYVMFMDCDDLIEVNKVEAQLKSLKNRDDCIVGCDWIKFRGDFSNKTIVKNGADDLLRADLDPVDWLIIAWSNNYMFPPLCWLVSKKIIDRVGLWDEKLKQNQDGEYFARVLLYSKKVIFCKDAKVYYRTGIESSISSGRQKKHFISRLTSYRSYVTHLLQVEDTARTRYACACNFRRLSFDVYPTHPDLFIQCESEIKKLGVDISIVPKSGRIFNLLTFFFGWKVSIRLKSFLYYLGYENYLIRKRSNKSD